MKRLKRGFGGIFGGFECHWNIFVRKGMRGVLGFCGMDFKSLMSDVPYPEGMDYGWI